MIRLSPQLMIAAANALVGLEVPPNDTSPNGLVALVRRTASLSDHGRWDTAILHHIGYWSHFDVRSERSSWPVPAAESAEELAAFGLQRGALSEAPHPGDIFLMYGPSQLRFVRSGLVVHVERTGKYEKKGRYFETTTIEGNTNELGAIGGNRMMRLTRRLCPGAGDRFLRWPELDPYLVLSGPTKPVRPLPVAMGVAA